MPNLRNEATGESEFHSQLSPIQVSVKRTQGVISLEIKTVGAWPLTTTLCLKFRGTEAVPSAPYTSFTTCRLINYAPTTFHFPFVQAESVMVDTTHITTVSFYNTCTLHNLQFLIICIYATIYRVIKNDGNHFACL
jgi:hypothetical protein